MTRSVSGCCLITRRRKPSGSAPRHPSAASCASPSARSIAGVGGLGHRDPQQHTPMARDLAGTIGPMAHALLLMRAEIEEAEPDDAPPAALPTSPCRRGRLRVPHAVGPPGLPLPRPPRRTRSGLATRRRPSASRKQGHDAGAGNRGCRAGRSRNRLPAPAGPRRLRGRARRRLSRRIPASRRRPGRPVEPGRPRH